MSKLPKGYTLNPANDKAIPIVVRGQRIDKTIIHAFGRRLNSTDVIITQWANASILELVLNKNSNWFYEMFKCKAFILDNGGLNKLGLEVFGYVQAHFPRALYNKETKTLGLKKFLPEGPLVNYFVSVGDTAPDEALGIVEINGAFYRPHGDFALTFSEYRSYLASLPKEDDDDGIKPVTAKAFLKSLENSAKAQDASKFIGSPEELAGVIAAMGTLGDALRQQLAATDKKAIDRAIKVLADLKDAEEAHRARMQVNPKSPTTLELSAEEKAEAAAKLAEATEASEANQLAEAAKGPSAKSKARQLAKEAKAANKLSQDMAESAERAEAGTVVDVAGPVGSFTLAEVI